MNTKPQKTFNFGSKTVSQELVSLVKKSLRMEAEKAGLEVVVNIVDNHIFVYTKKGKGYLTVRFGEWTKESYPLQEASIRVAQILRHGLEEAIFIKDCSLHTYIIELQNK